MHMTLRSAATIVVTHDSPRGHVFWCTVDQAAGLRAYDRFDYMCGDNGKYLWSLVKGPTTVHNCKLACDAHPDCGGFVYDCNGFKTPHGDAGTAPVAKEMCGRVNMSDPLFSMPTAITRCNTLLPQSVSDHYVATGKMPETLAESNSYYTGCGEVENIPGFGAQRWLTFIATKDAAACNGCPADHHCKTEFGTSTCKGKYARPSVSSPRLSPSAV